MNWVVVKGCAIPSLIALSTPVKDQKAGKKHQSLRGKLQSNAYVQWSDMPQLVAVSRHHAVAVLQHKVEVSGLWGLGMGVVLKIKVTTRLFSGALRHGLEDTSLL